MSACTFFGHRDCPNNIQDKLSVEIERLYAERRGCVLRRHSRDI